MIPVPDGTVLYVAFFSFTAITTNYKQITLHSSGKLETLQVPVTDTAQHSQSFKASDPPGVWQPILGLNAYDYISNKNFYKSFAYACINKKALNLAKAKIYLYREFKSKRSEQPAQHPFLKLLRSANSYGQSFKEILYVSSANCDINGWAYVKIVTLQTPFTALGKNGKTPVELIPLPAKMMRPVYDSQNSMVLYYKYNNQRIEADEIIRFRVPNPMSNLLPNPPVEAFNFTLDIDYFSARARRKFFDHDARPTLAVKFPNDLGEDFERYDEIFNGKHAGQEYNGRAVIVDQGAEVEALNANPRELDYVNSREQILQEIELILDVNDQVMGRFKDSNYNNSRNAINSWLTNSIQPYADMTFNEPLNKFVYDYYDPRLITVMEYDVVDPDYNLKLFDTGGPITDNEKRRLLNWDDYDDPRADQLYKETPKSETKPADTSADNNKE